MLLKMILVSKALHLPAFRKLHIYINKGYFIKVGALEHTSVSHCYFWCATKDRRM